MKLFALTLVAAALADEKKVPPKTPEDRMEQLKRHVGRLMGDFFSGCKKADQWEDKMLKLCDRALKTYKREDRPCSFFDPNLEHGGPAEDDPTDVRYSEDDAVSSIKGITSGIKKWSQRYLAECGGQNDDKNLVRHANKWRAKLLKKYEDGC